MSLTLGGNVVIRQGNALDYCWRECINSLLPVCDEVSVLDGESTDGTQEELREWAKREPKLKLAVYPWPNPHNDGNFFVDWCNANRERLQTQYQFQLDADEVLDENSYDEILEIKKRDPEPRFSVWVDRLNFYIDHKHLIPDGYCCGKFVIRIAPQPMWLASDGENPRGVAVPQISQASKIRIFHYGFLREREAYFKKQRAIQDYFTGSYDPRLEMAEKLSGNWMKSKEVCEWADKVLPYDGPHPKVAREWLRARNYDC